MFNIGNFLSKIQNSRSKEIIFRLTVQKAIKNHLSLDVPIESIKFRAGAVIVSNIVQSARSTLFIKKQAILDEINKNQQTFMVGDIR